MEKIIIRESKRNNATFRHYALECLGEFVDLRQNIDMYDQVYSVTKPVIEEFSNDAEEMDVDSLSGGPSSRSVKETTIANALKTLIVSINPGARKVEALNLCLSQTLELIMTVNRSEKGNRTIQYAIFDALELLFQKLRQIGSKVLPKTLEDTLIEFTKLLFTSNDQVEHVRVKAAEAVIALAPLAKCGERIKPVYTEGLSNVRGQERSSTVQHSLDLAKKILQE